MSPAALAILKSELDTDPIPRGYSTLSDEDAAKTFAVLDRQPNADVLTSGILGASVTAAAECRRVIRTRTREDRELVERARLPESRRKLR